jgi:thioredoxin-dependent peroxiredoxin
MLEVGQLAPRFEGRDQNDAEVRSEELLSRGPVVLYFYPKDFTPGCTREACLFRDAFEDLQGLGAAIVGVSVDTGESHRRFAERYQIPFSLLSDPDRKLAHQYQIVRPLGLGARRATFVIGADGRIRGVFHHEISMSRHVSDVRSLLVRMQGEQGIQPTR